MYQVLNHLIQSKQIDSTNLEEYKQLLQKAYNKNKQFERIDIDYYKNQTYLINYLKALKVNKHYLIGFNYSSQIKDIESVNNNIKQICEYLNIQNEIGYILNNNPELLVTSAEKIKDSYEYLTSTVGINKKIILAKPNLLNDIELAEKFYKKCQEIRFEISQITNSSFLRGNLKLFCEMLSSKEYQDHPELFTSETLAHATLEEIQKIIHSEEYQDHPELFTSETLAHATLEEIQKIIHSEEYQDHPELFTSTTLAHGNLKEIREILKMEQWKDNRYSKLLSTSILNKKRLSIELNIKMAEYFGIEEHINVCYLMKSPTQNYALIMYLNNNIVSVQNDKLYSIFCYQPGELKKRFNIDLKELMVRYPLNMEQFNQHLQTDGGRQI